MRPSRLLIAKPPLAGRLAALDAELVETATPDVIRREAHRLRALAREGAFTRPPEAATIVYRLATDDHQQTGVVVDVAVEDYRGGRIRRHEATRPKRERQLADFLEAARLELVPLTLAHRARPRLRSLLAEVTAGEPHLHVVSADGLAQTVWIGRSAHIRAELADLDALYIADGHHRMAAAQRYAARHPGGEFVLGALFAADEMRVLGHHRALARPAGPSTPDLVGTLASLPGTELLEESAEVPASAPGTVAVRLDDRWYRLRLRAPADALDIVTLENGVLAPLLDGADPRTDPRVTPLPGTYDAGRLARWCTEHTAIGFLLHPPGVEQILAVADAGQVMPPKSTWFDPKARAGPFLRDLA